MRKINILNILVVFVASSLCSHAQAPSTNGLLAYYPFNGNANDVSGNGNNASFTGALLTADRFGVANSAFHFNGAGDRMSASVASIPVGNAPRSILAWIKPEAGSFINGVVHHGRDDCFGLMFGLAHTFERVSFWGGCQDYASSLIAPANQWSLVGLTYDGLKLGIYVNQESETYEITPLNTTLSRLWIGAETLDDGGSFRHYFSGAIDDVRFYNRALSSNEVAQIYAYDSYCSPHRSRATATLVNGFVVGATITDRGCGYTNTPLVLIQGGGGSGATATAVVSNGVVVGITFISAGCCYTSVPRIAIASPPFVPTLNIQVSKVKVTQNVVLGRKYVLESSMDLLNWMDARPPFTADDESITNEFDVGVMGSFFRIRQVP